MNPPSDDETEFTDHEARIFDWIDDMPLDMEPEDLEWVVLAIANAYVTDDTLPAFLLTLAVKAKLMHNTMEERKNATTH
jgi:hypothetical protein